MSQVPGANGVQIQFSAVGTEQVKTAANDATKAVQGVGEAAANATGGGTLATAAASLKEATSGARDLRSALTGALGTIGAVAAALRALGTLIDEANPSESNAGLDRQANARQAFESVSKEIEQLERDRHQRRLAAVNQEEAEVFAIQRDFADKRDKLRSQLGATGQISTEQGAAELSKLNKLEEDAINDRKAKQDAARQAQAARDQAALDRFNQEQADAENARLRERDAQRQLNERALEEAHEEEMRRIEEQNAARIRGIREYAREVEAAIRKQRDLAFANTNLANLGRGGERAFAALLMRTGGR